MSKPSQAEFLEWSSADSCGQFRSKLLKKWFESVQSNIITPYSASDGVKVHVIDEFDRFLSASAEKYREEFGVGLFSAGREGKVEWQRKSFDSVVNKIYRINCIENDNFPGPPPDGWVSIGRVFECIDDLVRATVVVSYADGPVFLAREFRRHFNDEGVGEGAWGTVKDHAKEKGYYAHHFYVSYPVEMMAVDSGRTPESSVFIARVKFEIHVTTELQAALREVTHLLYEDERIGQNLDSLDWKHEFRSGRFRAAYMAHSLRFVEGMLVELRDATVAGRSRDETLPP